MKKECEIVETQHLDTVGIKQKILVCYCQATACTKVQVTRFPVPEDFNPNVFIPEEIKGYYSKMYPPTYGTRT